MRKILTLTPALIVVGLAGVIAAEHMPRGSATDIPNADIQAMAKSLASMPGGDKLLRVASINGGEYNVGVAVVHRAKAANIQASLEHSQITEIYHVISGSGTMVSGGTIENGKDTTDANTLGVVGPSSGGGKVVGGRSRKIGPGDVVIVPPNTPHGWSEVTEELVYLVVRMDPHKVLKVQ
jgi:mannose-6-phosphate isomerase-like protein (cupin superfamily)